jgi:carbamoyltransferase
VRVLGIGGSHHDFCACLVEDGEVISGIEEERLARVKVAFGLGPRLQRCLASQYVLNEAGVGIDDIDLIVANDFLNPVYTVRLPDRIKWIGHHISHAASTFYSSPFDHSAVLVIDGRGSSVERPDGLFGETITYYRADERQFATVAARTGRVTLTDTRSEDPYEDSVGWMYEAVSKSLGFIGPGGMGEPGKTMGLAAYGGPRYVEAVGDTFWLADGEFKQSNAEQIRLRDLIARELAAAGNERLRAEVKADFAYAVQVQTENIVLHLARWLHKQTGETRLCMAGGVALNSVANFKILEDTPFEDLHIVPAAGDSGTALGAALYGYHQIAGQAWAPSSHPFSPYLGRRYDAAEIARAVAEAGDQVSAEFPGDLDELVAAELDAGSIVGWFQGRSEMGPRALGNRSILADPRPASMKDKINEKVKHREHFRPFAPVVRQHRQADYFATDIPAYYMLLVPRVLAEQQNVIAAVTHVDGTARLQTVSKELNPRLDSLLAAFERRTGVPVLLNTSFNDKNEPIVETPQDAMRCFLSTDIDILVLGDSVIRKTAGVR